jgi:Domain of unknown function (DUF4333)
MIRLRLLALPAAASLALAACGDKKLDTGKLEGEIKKGIERQAGVKVRSVNCPGDVKIQRGHVFNCRATTTSGQTAPVRVTQRDDEGNVNYQVGG